MEDLDLELCPNCEKNPVKKKIFACNFCSKYFCSMNCLMKHISLHSKTDVSIANTLKKRQSKDTTMQFSFMKQGIFIDNCVYDKDYDIKNFSKVYDGFIPVELGSGAFGHVYLVVNNFTKKKYALKVINKRKLLQTYGNCELVYNEIEIHSKLNHPNIIRLYNTSENDEEINILLEYAEHGSLFNLIQKQNGFPESKAYEYFIQIVNAVYFLHQNNIIHRDIKPENILIGENNELKLCDFGWAKVLTMENRHTFCGTMEYMAPEIVGSEKYDFGVDTWSLGILLYELLMGHSPFRAKKDKNIMLKIKLHDLSLDENKLSKECIDLISGLLDPNPLNRLKIKDILVHPFVTSNSKKGENKKNGNRKESNDDSNENTLRFLNGKKKNFTEEFNNLRKKFGFDSKLNIKDKLSSKNLIEFKSDRNITSVKTFNFKNKNLRNESKILNKLKDNMTSQLEQAKKKFGYFNFKSEKQLSFEDFRDNSNLLDNSKTRETHETSNFENTLENEGEKNNSFESIDEEDDSV